MKYIQAPNHAAEAIAYLIACEGYNKEAAEAAVTDHQVLDALRERAAKHACSTKGHNYTDSGSYASPEGAADDLSCSRCGFRMQHIYF